MKNKFGSILWTIILVANLISCNDFLEEDPKDLLVASNSFLTESDAVASVAGIYKRLTLRGGGQTNEVYNGETGWLPLEATSNQVLWNDGKSIWDSHAYGSGDGKFNDLWKGFYEAISRANLVIEQIQQTDLPNKAEIEGEARFLRAYSYFMLVNLFGDVPLRTESVNSAEQSILEVPANSTEEIYTTVIIPDLQFATENLPDWRNKEADKYRVTKIAAQAMLARVYLYLEDWQNAMNAAEKAWSEGLAAGFGLFENYMQTFGESFQAGKEHLFFLNYDAIHNSDLLNRKISPNNNKIIRAAGWGNPNYIEPNFYKNWPNDFRKQSSAPTGFYNPQGKWVPFPTGNGYIAKHWDPTATSGWGGANKNLIRFAEVYLIYAEAANEVNGGPDAKAIEALNTIRQRARNFYTLDYLGGGTLVAANSTVVGLESVDAANPPSQSLFRDMVYNERDWEFAGEYQSRLENVRRHRMAKKGTIDSKYLLSNVLADFGSNVDDNIHEVFPIPFRELQLNPKLQQNPGY